MIRVNRKRGNPIKMIFDSKKLNVSLSDTVTSISIFCAMADDILPVCWICTVNNLD